MKKAFQNGDIGLKGAYATIGPGLLILAALHTIIIFRITGQVAEPADATASKVVGLTLVRVRLPPCPPIRMSL